MTFTAQDVMDVLHERHKAAVIGEMRRGMALMLVYGGGGHENAGTCQVPNEQADAVLKELVARINAVG